MSSLDSLCPSTLLCHLVLPPRMALLLFFRILKFDLSLTAYSMTLLAVPS